MKGCVGPRGRWLILLAGLALGCTSGISVVESAPGRKKIQQKLARADSGLPLPRKLPTISAIDWRGFPRGKGHGSSGRIIEVRPGATGAIASALSRARSGDTVLIRGGTYTEGLQWDSNALLIRRDGIVLRAMPGERVRVRPRKGANYGLVIAASNVLVDGIELEGFIRAGVLLGSQRGTISNIILSNLKVKAPRDGQFHDGIVSYLDFRAMKKPVVDGLLLRNVTVLDAGLGISCNSGPCRSWWLENVTVRNAAHGGWGADAIAVESGENIVMVNVEVKRATADGIDLKAGKVLISGCNVHHVGRNGIKAWRGADIVNTMVHHVPGGEAFVFDAAGRYRVLNSLAAYVCAPRGRCYTAISGYDTKARQRVEVINSIFYKTHGALFFADNTAVRVENCMFHGVTNQTAVDARTRGRRVTVKTGGSPRAFDKLGLGSGNLFQDPRFVDPAAGDFRLKAGSPARDAGRVTGAPPARDRLGRARSRGGAPDMGPHEM